METSYVFTRKINFSRLIMHSLDTLQLMDDLGITDDDIFINETGAVLEHNNISAGFDHSEYPYGRKINNTHSSVYDHYWNRKK